MSIAAEEMKFYGGTIAQTIYYYQAYLQDSIKLKSLVLMNYDIPQMLWEAVVVSHTDMATALTWVVSILHICIMETSAIARDVSPYILMQNAVIRNKAIRNILTIVATRILKGLVKDLRVTIHDKATTSAIQLIQIILYELGPRKTFGGNASNLTYFVASSVNVNSVLIA
ncbi:hypothetical protein WOLCODRAFT_17980 [Wolfiporia cocos MD-104 SS10]|uniref:Uncharacterized protein n=1 Tax=Wolfiporia cocos (strain MD-104) TaxID=742152 RepID=A0A2H3JKW9_WOLCO|nr:hypothetical protein WOLCODRAFT_17980 [Wolfiporia cocos MD-104 SS10]